MGGAPLGGWAGSWQTALDSKGGRRQFMAPSKHRETSVTEVFDSFLTFSFVYGLMGLSITLLGQNTRYAAAHPTYPIAAGDISTFLILKK